LYTQWGPAPARGGEGACDRPAGTKGPARRASRRAGVGGWEVGSAAGRAGGDAGVTGWKRALKRTPRRSCSCTLAGALLCKGKACAKDRSRPGTARAGRRQGASAMHACGLRARGPAPSSRRPALRSAPGLVSRADCARPGARHATAGGWRGPPAAVSAGQQRSRPPASLSRLTVRASSRAARALSGTPGAGASPGPGRLTPGPPGR